MMICPKCNSHYNNNFKFCPYCGNELITKKNNVRKMICPNCNRNYNNDYNFCPYCSEELIQIEYSVSYLIYYLKNHYSYSSPGFYKVMSRINSKEIKNIYQLRKEMDCHYQKNKNKKRRLGDKKTGITEEEKRRQKEEVERRRNFKNAHPFRRKGF